MIRFPACLASCLVLSVALNAQPADCSRVHLLATHPYLADIAEVISGGLVSTTTLLEPGQDVPHYKVTADDRRAAREAVALLVIGGGAEPWLNQLIPAGTSAAPLVAMSENGSVFELAQIGNALKVTDVVERLLGELCPGEADVFAFNSALYRQQLLEIQEELDLRRASASSPPIHLNTRDRAPKTYRAWLRQQHGLPSDLPAKN